MKSLLKILKAIATKADKIYLFFFLFVSVLASLIEIFLLYSVGIFLSDVTSVSMVNIDMNRAFGLMALLLVSLLVQVLNIRLLAFIATNMGVKWSSKVLSKLYENDYRNLSTLKVSNVINFSVTETSRFTDYVLLPVLTLTSKIFLVASVTILLFVKFTYVSLVFFAVFSFIYIAIYIFVRRDLNHHSKEVSSALENRNNIVLNSFMNLKDTKIRVSQKEKVLDSFFKEGERIVESQKFTYVAVQLPRYLIEFVVLISVLIMLTQNFLNTSLIVFAIAAFRTLPHVQAIYSAFALLQSAKSSFSNVVNYFSSIGNTSLYSREDEIEVRERYVVEKIESLKVENLSFSHGKNIVFSDFSFTANFEDAPLMLVGKTGSGKSTLIDVIAGLYPEHYDNLKINDKSILEIDVIQYQESTAYIPQMYFCKKTYLYDCLAEVDSCPNDASVITLFHDLDLSFLAPNKIILNYELEENFKNLSGGQRQRLILLLAILRRPKLLILDEATNALDKKTEEKVLKKIMSFSIPLIIITHNPIMSDKFNIINLGD